MAGRKSGVGCVGVSCFVRASETSEINQVAQKQSPTSADFWKQKII